MFNAINISLSYTDTLLQGRVLSYFLCLADVINYLYLFIIIWLFGTKFLQISDPLIHTVHRFHLLRFDVFRVSNSCN